MGNEWGSSTLEDAGVILLDCVHKTPADAGSGIPYIAIPQIKNGCINFAANPRLISTSDYEKWTIKAKPQADDIVLSRRCNPGETAYVPEGREFALGQNLVLLRSSCEKVYPPFLRWLVRGPEWWAQVSKFLNVGAVFDSLRCGDIPNFELLLPPPPEQKAIAHILGSLDDKIELNRQMNETLESMAQALFKSWFVDFDPVIDNALAAGNPISDVFAERAEQRRELNANAEKSSSSPNNGDIIELSVSNNETASSLKSGGVCFDFAQQPSFNGSENSHQSLFPSEFEFTEEIGWIPKGWEVNALETRIDVLNGFAFKSKDYVDKGIFVLRTKNFNDQSKVDLIKDDVYLPIDYEESYSKYLSEPFDYHLIMVGASVGNRGLIGPHQLPALRNQNMWCFRPKPDSKVSKSYVKYMLDSIITQKLGLASGSAREFFRKGDFQQHLISYASDDVLLKFDEIAFSYLEKQSQNDSENITLAKLRDTLLPKLLSGELRILDAEKLIKEAGV